MKMPLVVHVAVCLLLGSVCILATPNRAAAQNSPTTPDAERRDALLNRFDGNGDGVISESEKQFAMKAFKAAQGRVAPARNAKKSPAFTPLNLRGRNGRGLKLPIGK